MLRIAYTYGVYNTYISIDQYCALLCGAFMHNPYFISLICYTLSDVVYKSTQIQSALSLHECHAPDTNTEVHTENVYSEIARQSDYAPLCWGILHNNSALTASPALLVKRSCTQILAIQIHIAKKKNKSARHLLVIKYARRWLNLKSRSEFVSILTDWRSQTINTRNVFSAHKAIARI